MLLTIAGWVVFGFLVGVVVEIVRPGRSHRALGALAAVFLDSRFIAGHRDRT